jgi:hypothetical protein
MSSNDITEKPDDRPGLPVAVLETGGPSVMAADEPTFARTLAMIGGALVIFGGMALGFNLAGAGTRVSTGWAVLALTIGLSMMLFHAAFDRDVQLRRLYMIFGFAVVALGLILCVVPWPDKVGDQFRWAVPCLLIGLLFLISFLRNEDDRPIRNYSQLFLGVVGAILAVAGVLGGFLRVDYFLPMGLVLGLIGLAFLAAFIASRGISDDLGFYAALAICLLGVLVIVITLGRSIFPATGYRFFVSQGFLFLLVGLAYLAVGAGLSLDWPLFVLTRRELGSFFLSPIAYLTLAGFTIVGGFQYGFFLIRLFDNEGGMVMEPIVHGYFYSLFPVIVVIFVPSVLTMRLLSEEQRTGTMEVLLTAPVDETVVVFSKFIAALLMFLIVWTPFWLYLLAIPLMGGTAFDYRPLLGFVVTLTVTGAGFIGMGLFFSSVTKNQIAAGVLTLAGMLVLTAPHLVQGVFRDPTVGKVLFHVSYIDLWWETLRGKIVPQYLLFYLSLASLSLFLTVKVLESRKWR